MSRPSYRVVSWQDGSGNSRKLFLNKHEDDSVDCWDDDSQLVAEVSGHHSCSADIDFPIEALPY